MELAGTQMALTHAVVLGQPGQQDGADRHVDADTQGVRPAHNAQKPLLGKAFDKASITRQHAGMMHPDSCADRLRQGFAEARAETEIADLRCDRIAFGPAADVGAEQRLCAFHRGDLGEVHHVDRRPVFGDQILDGLVHGPGGVRIFQRHRASGAGDVGGVTSGTPP